MPATNELLQEGRYRISQPSTHQGEDKLFEAYDTVRNTPVVVREIPVRLNRVATVSQRESLKLAFANQAKALTEIEHESLLHVHDYFSEIDRQYLVMEAIEGDSLGDLLAAKKKPFSIAEVTNWADELLDALHYLHSRKPSIIHRNINPANVTLHPSGKIKLIGVGVESSTDAELAPAPADGDNLHYSPIEQIWPGLDPASQKAITNHYDDRSERMLKQPLDERSDIFSLGATLYFLITGVEPVDPLERSIELLEGKLDPLREPTSFDSSIPPEISDVLMKSLEIKRENRYDSAVIMRQVLKTAITRVREREEEESSQQSAASESAQHTAQANAEASRAAVAAEKQREAEAEHKRQSELMQRQLLEAEAQRAEAERNAEADRLLQEKEKSAEAAEVPATGLKVPDDNLLEIPVAAEVVAYRDTTAVEEDDLAAVLRELEEADASASGATHRMPAADVTFDSPVDLGPQSSAAVSDSGDEHDDIFSVPEKAAFSLPIPAIAGAIGLVVVLIVGGWFVMSGSSEPPKPEPVQVAQPAPVEPNPAMETIVSSQSDTNSATTENATDPVAVASKTAPTPKPKKADAAKAEKKKVTVDDLINDN